MESLGDALKRINIRPASMVESSVPEEGLDPAEPGEGCPQCGGTGWVIGDFPVEHPDFGRAYPCVCRRQEAQRTRLERLQRYSNLGALGRITFAETLASGRTPDATSQRLFDRALVAARSYARNPMGWLVLVGPSGAGKTHLAAAIANERLRQGEPALFVVVPDLLDHLRAAYSPNADLSYDELSQRVREAPFLILDDLGSHASTSWAQEKLAQIINHRFMAHLPTVLTLGVPLESLDARLRSRLTDPGISQVCQVASGGSAWSQSDALSLPRFREMTFDSFVPQRADLTPEQQDNLQRAYRLARTYAEEPDGWLVLMGTHGSGKTHLAAAIANSCLQRGMPLLFLVVPDLLDHLRFTFSPDSNVTYDELFEGIKTAPMLVLDDLGAHATSPWAREKLYQIINYRYNARLPLVITTDLSLDELEQVETRISSRLADTRFSVPFYIHAPDFRVDRPVASPRSQRPPYERQRYPQRRR